MSVHTDIRITLTVTYHQQLSETGVRFIFDALISELHVLTDIDWMAR